MQGTRRHLRRDEQAEGEHVEQRAVHDEVAEVGDPHEGAGRARGALELQVEPFRLWARGTARVERRVEQRRSVGLDAC